MEIKIAHLYYDLLNLYGEQGNVTALVNALNKQKLSLKVDLLTIGDKIDFQEYDLFYLGCGSEENLFIVLDDIKKYKKQIKEVINKGKFFISTGNSRELFGKYIELNNQRYKALSIFDYYALQNIYTRIVGESFMEFEQLSKPIIGFQNRECIIQNGNKGLFKLIKGYADNYSASYEGHHENNFFGSYLLGPLLIRNPHFTDYIVKNLLKSKDIKYNNIKDTYEHRAYEEYIKNFYENGS